MTDTVDCPKGYRYAGVVSGLRSEPNRRDIALVVSDRPASVAGVFTQNRVCAAPVQVCRARVPGAHARGVVICSGNANACTGEQGLRDARAMTQTVATVLGVVPEAILVASTGIIGRPLPMPVVIPGIHQALSALTPESKGLDDAAAAILTTDTCTKLASTRFSWDGVDYTVTGFAKGAAMIGPNMATMLAFVLTDAPVAPTEWQEMLAQAVDASFNCISVEGHMSTNDTVLAFANGAAGGRELQGAGLDLLAHALDEICTRLARKIIQDAEGATHILTLHVEGLRTVADARKIAKTVAESALVKTALFGADPNWGRIVSAAGYAGVDFAERDVSLWLAGTLLYDRGVPVPFDAAAVSNHIKSHREIDARLVFTLGTARTTFWTSDLTYDYVRLNADYTT